MEQIQGKSFLVQVSTNFKLPRVQVTGSQLYCNNDASSGTIVIADPLAMCQCTLPEQSATVGQDVTVIG